MGRKSSAKTQTRSSSAGGGAPEQPKRSSSALVAVAVVVLAAVAGVFVAMRPSQTTPADVQAAAAAPVAAPQAADTPPPSAKFGPHTQQQLPPLPFQAYAPPRSPEIVRAAYTFAAEHPEILSYVPCFCGCERGGHRGNDDCFVKTRAANGDVVEWEPHGLECTVCLDVAHDAEQMFRSGASVRDIRSFTEKKWASFQGGHTPTPQPK